MQEFLDIDVEKDKIDAFTREDFIGGTYVCEYLMSIDDRFERKKREIQVYERARALKAANDFKALYKAYKQKLAIDKSGAGGYRTRFIDQPIELNCGDWECSKMVRKMVDESMKIASPIPLLVTQILKNSEDDVEKIELAFYKNGMWQYVVCKRSVSASASKIVELANSGVEVNSENAKLLVQYIADLVRYNFDVIPTNPAIGRLGWYNGEFVPYNTDVRFDGRTEHKALYNAVSQCGDFEAWIDFTHGLRKNILLRIQMAVSFASPLIEKVNALPFILHFWGGTEAGKTAGMAVASSVWGNPQKGKMWRALNNTTNFVMQLSTFYYNLPVCLDELQTIKQFNESYDKLIMCITEGIDRGRMNYQNTERTKTWECAYIFTGEEPVLKDFSGGGAKNRVIEVECTGKVMEDGNKAVEFVSRNYGHAGMKFIESICKEKNLTGQYRKIYKEILNQCDTTEKQAMSMGLILLGDALAVKYIYTNEKPLGIEDIKRFLASSKEVDVSERAYEYVLNLAAVNSNRFLGESSGEIWGSIDETGGVITINKAILVREMSAKGFEFDAVKRKWYDRGYLIPNSQGKFLHSTKVYNIKASYVKLRFTDNGPEYSSNSPPF